MLRRKQNKYDDGLHYLMRLTYVSRANKQVDATELRDILKKAKENNNKNGITGILVFNKNFFLQSIEGSRVEINHLLNTLEKDPRHYDLQIISAQNVNERIWGLWSMDYVTPSSNNKAEFLRFSPGNEFNPYIMKAAAVEKMLLALSESKQSQSDQQANKHKKKGLFF